MSQVSPGQIPFHPLFSQPHPHQRLGMSLVAFCLWFLAGCSIPLQQTDAAVLPLDDALPASWQAVGDVQAVNIDGDAATEYLLLFTYDATAARTPATSFLFQRNAPQGPIGAVIYDTQIMTETTIESTRPDKSVDAFVPYPLLPSYRQGAGQGFIAEPTQRAAVELFPVAYRTGGGADTLILLGGETYLTFAWWQNRMEGYGVMQLYAPGGFETTPYTAFDWAEWRRDPQPIRQLIALHPLHDRNLICRRLQYELDATSVPTTIMAGDSLTQTWPIRFQTTDLGLQFCYDTPDHPFYPEGVVLAYLLTGNAALLDPVTAPTGGQSIGLTTLQQLVQNGGRVRVSDLASYATLASAALSPAVVIPPNNMAVCATIETLTTATTAAENSGVGQQTLLVTLRHEPPQLQTPTPDRLFITNVEMIAAPHEGGVIHCRELLGG